MIGSVLVASMLLVGQTAAPTHSGDEQKTTTKAAAEVDPQKAVSEYNVLKEKTPMTAAARWKLALWCEEHGLKDIAYVHFGEVISARSQARCGLEEARIQEARKPVGDRRADRR